jgi:DUF4097 and DUF4098 domain-containing protein YvlB
VNLNKRRIRFQKGSSAGTTLARAFATAAILACLAVPGRAADDTMFHKVFPLTAGGNFQLDNVNGSVRVEGWDRDEVEVSAIKVSKSGGSDVSQVTIDVESHPGAVNVHTHYPKGEGAEVAVEYRVHVPFRVLLGSVGTVNGSVIVKGVDGGGELRTVNGNVEVFDSAGRFSEKTTNGNLRLELRKLAEGGPMKLETVNGSVILGLPAGSGANVNALSMNGELYSEFPVTSKTGMLAPRAFNGRLGTGGGNISVRTINGGIKLLLQHPAV